MHAKDLYATHVKRLCACFVFSHFANTAFYRTLKLNKMNTHNHPVVATIFNYIEVGAK